MNAIDQIEKTVRTDRRRRVLNVLKGYAAEIVLKEGGDKDTILIELMAMYKRGEIAVDIKESKDKESNIVLPEKGAFAF